MSVNVTSGAPSATSRGCFITLEGVDGAGKSTHVQWLAEQIMARGIPVVSTREPGGTALGERLRQMLLHDDMDLATETLLMFAARNEHLSSVIKPALAAGNWVICDRFTDASYAYQGAGRRLGADRVRTLETWVHPDLQPDCTILFDVPLSVARERLNRGRELDRFEHEQTDFFERTRAAYLERASQHPQRFCVIDSTREIPATRATLLTQLDQLVSRFAPGSADAPTL